MSADPTQTNAWKNLERMTAPDMRALFTTDPDRAKNFTRTLDGLYVDFAKTPIDEHIMQALLGLAREQNIEDWRARLFSGDHINNTEDRAVLHSALRRPKNDTVNVEGKNIIPFIHDVLGRMKSFCAGVHNGDWRGYSGKKIDTIVNIGIGGSDLGPHMVCEALKAYAVPDMNIYFVSNVDSTHLIQTLEQCDPETTLFLIASKTFTTQETMANAHSARAWFLKQAPGTDEISRHFVALSTNEQAVEAFGIAPTNMFPFRDWVGGRYSLWSAIGLSIALALGFDAFEKLLAGAHAMDRHFETAPLEENIPVLLALIGIWHRNFLHYPAYAVLPYDQNLSLLPAFLQQLDMESNGKGVDRAGKIITAYQTGPILFGEPGTNGQHAFYQLIHQGMPVIPCDFIAAKDSNYPLGNHHDLLLTHMLAQGQALLQGRDLTAAGNNPHRVFSGNRPSTTIILDKLDPYHLGMLIALYEHKIFVQGIVWNINSFDQYGVELGKELAKALESGKADTADSSTLALKRHLGLA